MNWTPNSNIDPTMKDLFTCKDCGSNELIVVKTGTDQREYFEATPCSCGKAEFSSTRQYTTRTGYEFSGPLDPFHHWEYEEREFGDAEISDEPGSKIHCEQCFEEVVDADWRTAREPLEGPDSFDIYVRCGGCDREIEFGWSHPDGGRIWPVECADFDPWRAWPEKRYQGRLGGKRVVEANNAAPGQVTREPSGWQSRIYPPRFSTASQSGSALKTLSDPWVFGCFQIHSHSVPNTGAGCCPENTRFWDALQPGMKTPDIRGPRQGVLWEGFGTGLGCIDPLVVYRPAGTFSLSS